eukprot:2267448-Prorocentrum_lima.AAC.1
MTSSLVGSEMCIRDRPQAGPCAASLSLRRGAYKTKSPARQTSGEQAHPPVSYTHLTLPTICSV